MLAVCIISCSTEKKPETDNSALLGAGAGFANTVIVVKNLDSSSSYFAKVLGFTMPEKFEQGMYEGTLSSYVGLPDWSSIELLSVKDTGLVAKQHAYINQYSKLHEGVRMYSLFTSSVDTTRTWLSTRGVKTSAPESGRMTKEMPKGWDWDDGGPQWRSVSFNASDPPAQLPHFMEIVGLPYDEIQREWKPYSWRKYYPENPNGVVGTTSIQLVVGDLQATRNEFAKAGFKELYSNDSSAGFKIVRNQQLHVRTPRLPGDRWSNFLKTRGPGLYSITLEVKNMNDTRKFLQKTLPAKALLFDSTQKRLTVFEEYAKGVQLEFVEESKEQSALAKIYSFKEGEKMDTASLRHAAGMYAKYCGLCHGKEREGYAADFAPSLRSKSLMATTQSPRSSYNYLSHAISYGRPGTAMAPYAKSQGGPLADDDIALLIQWMHELSGVKKPIEMSVDPIAGDAAKGKTIYANKCASCHGSKGEGISAPALGNPMLLATASDAFLRYTIAEGRDGTPMPSFKDSLNKSDINAVTAYIRSRASGWSAPNAIAVKKPSPKDYVLNPRNKPPKFSVRQDLYVSAEQVLKAIKDSARMILLDARSEAAWHQTHIPGAVSVPYYKEPDKFIKDLPNDSTWIVVYCACPHAASSKVVNTLRRFGYKHTAIIDEGVLVWTQRGYPVQYGEGIKAKK